MKSGIIGIVGGMGPYAGLDLNKKIFDFTIAHKDQDHLNVILYSVPNIGDRTQFVLGKAQRNPAENIYQVIRKMELAGAHVIGIPCNTSHAPQIFDALLQKLKRSNSQIEVVNMVTEVAKYIEGCHPAIKRVGVLATKGTVCSDVYSKCLGEKGIIVIYPDEEVQDSVHQAIYDANFGIKAISNPVTKKSQEKILVAINHLKENGAECVVLGCTELPLAVNADTMNGIPILDTTLILAKALITKVALEKLKV